MIDAYLQEFDRWLVGTPAEKGEWRAELLAHLREADAVGQLADTLARLGSPRDAARAFVDAARLQPAPLRRRAIAAVIDYAPLILVSIGLAVFAFARSTHDVAFSLPASASWDSSRPLVDNVVRNVLVVVALIWCVPGLAVWELRTGRPPGQTILGLRTVAEAGTAIDRRPADVRRL